MGHHKTPKRAMFSRVMSVLWTSKMSFHPAWQNHKLTKMWVPELTISTFQVPLNPLVISECQIHAQQMGWVDAHWMKMDLVE